MFMKDMVDTCFRYVYPEDYKIITKFLEDNYSNHNEIVNKISKKLKISLNKT